MAVKDNERRKRYDSEYYAKPEVKKRLKEYNSRPEVKERRRTNSKIKAGKKERRLRQRYGITLEQRNKLITLQGNKCNICEATEPGGHGDWHVDHNHKTKRIRGILCCRCNRNLVIQRHTPELLRRAADYLEAYDDPSYYD